MSRLNIIINILLLIQTCSALPYGRSDGGIIEIGSNLSPAARDQFVVNAAVGRGMDGEAVAELLRTKQPVVKVNVDSNGNTITTTYTLGADGSISTSTITERKPVRSYHIGSVPDSVSLDELMSSPSGSVSKTYIDKDGNQVTQIVSMGKPKPTLSQPEDDEFDWFGTNIPNWVNSEFPIPVQRNNLPAEGGQTNYHKTITTYHGPNGEKSVTENWSSGPKSQEPAHKPPAFNWPTFKLPDESQIRQSETDGEDGNVWTVVDGQPDVEATAIKKHPSWRLNTGETNTNQRPFQPKAPSSVPSLEDFLDAHFKTSPPTGPTTKNIKPVGTQVEEAPTLPSLEDFLDTRFIATIPASPQSTHNNQVPIQPKVTKPLPTIEDFLDTQFRVVTPKTSPTLTAGSSALQPKVTTPLPSLEDFLESQHGPKKSPNSNRQNPVTIKVEDLPVTRILYNGEPVDANILKQLPPHLQPISQPVYENEMNLRPQKVESTRSHSSGFEPNMARLDPHIQELLQNAGISIDDITDIDGDTIIKKHTEPDGTIVTTTYKVRNIPLTVTSNKPAPTHTSSQSHSSNNIPDTPYLSSKSTPTKLSPVKEYLAKLGLTESDILAKNGEYSKTIIDDDGQVLTATFILSRPLSGSENLENTKTQKPLK